MVGENKSTESILSSNKDTMPDLTPQTHKLAGKISSVIWDLNEMHWLFCQTLRTSLIWEIYELSVRRSPDRPVTVKRDFISLKVALLIGDKWIYSSVHE